MGSLFAPDTSKAEKMQRESINMQKEQALRIKKKLAEQQDKLQSKGDVRKTRQNPTSSTSMLGITRDA